MFLVFIDVSPAWGAMVVALIVGIGSVFAMRATVDMMRNGQSELFRRVNDIDKRLARIEGRLDIALGKEEEHAA